MFKKLRLVAQVVGFLVIGMLVFFGAQSLMNGNAPVLAAIGLVDPTPQAPQAVTAIVPTMMHFQGTLRGPDGQLLTSGYYTLTFRIYDNLADPIGDAVWSEQHTGVTVFDGRFSALLGDAQPVATPLPTTLFSNPNLYIGVTVEDLGLGAEMLPRQRFASVPFAFYAERANGLSAADGSPADAAYVDNAGNVGVGTTSPTSKLDVRGTIRGAWDSSNYVEMTHGGSNGYINMVGAGNLDFRQEGFTRMSLTESGNLGIGTTAPSTKLDVAGNVTVNGTIQASGSISTTGDIAWNRATGHLTGFAVSDVYHATASGDVPFYQKVTMVPTSNSLCYLTEVRRYYPATDLARCTIFIESDNWVLEANAVIGQQITCAARCLQW